MATDRALLIPRVIGHRGAAASAPENTLAGFHRAAALGCRWVEFDVRLTGDGHPIVFHDDALDRLTGTAGAVAATPLDALSALRVRGEPIPTLARTLAELHALGLGGNIEMKAEAGREAALAESVARAIGAGPALPVLVSSFSVPALAAIAGAAPGIPRGFLTETLAPDWRETPTGLGAAAIIVDHRQLHAGATRTVRAAGFVLAAYTVNEPRRARDLFAWGVDAVISDAPDMILNLTE